MEEKAVESFGLVEATSSTDKDGQDAGVMAYMNETKQCLEYNGHQVPVHRI